MIVGIPLAGSRTSKNSILNLLEEIGDKTVLQISIQNLLDKINSKITKIIFIVKKEDEIEFGISKLLRQLIPPSIEFDTVFQSSVAKGAVCSLLLSADILTTKEEILICNANHFLDFDLNKILSHFKDLNTSCGTILFKSINPNWSYVKLNEDGEVMEVTEKVPISNLAIAGIYYFDSGATFKFAAFEAIKKNRNRGGLLYTSLIINELILNDYRISTFLIDENNYFPLNSTDRKKIFLEKYQ